MKTLKNNYVTSLLIGALTTAVSLNVSAGDSVQHSGYASANSARAVGHSVAAVGKTALTVAAVPFVLVGKVGAVSLSTGEAMLDLAGTPFEIGDEVVTAGPSPDKMISTRGD